MPSKIERAENSLRGYELERVFENLGQYNNKELLEADHLLLRLHEVIDKRTLLMVRDLRKHNNDVLAELQDMAYKFHVRAKSEAVRDNG